MNTLDDIYFFIYIYKKNLYSRIYRTNKSIDNIRHEKFPSSYCYYYLQFNKIQLFSRENENTFVLFFFFLREIFL